MPIQRLIPTNIEMFSGNTKLLRVTVLDQDSVVVDLTGASATYVVTTRRGNVPLISKTVGAGITITDAVNGVLEVTLAPADTEPLQGAHSHELKVTDAAGRQTTVLFGSLSILVNTA